MVALFFIAVMVAGFMDGDVTIDCALHLSTELAPLRKDAQKERPSTELAPLRKGAQKERMSRRPAEGKLA